MGNALFHSLALENVPNARTRLNFDSASPRFDQPFPSSPYLAGVGDISLTLNTAYLLFDKSLPLSF
jgi:hypothetical protein